MPQVENIAVSFENLPSLLHSDAANKASLLLCNKASLLLCNKAVVDDNTYSFALPILKFHHEKWDGTGYPYRFKGAEIPLPARIFSIVDVWNAITHKKVYKDAWPHNESLSYLKAESGRHFDPQVVDLFLYLEKQHSWYRT